MYEKKRHTERERERERERDVGFGLVLSVEKRLDLSHETQIYSQGSVSINI